MKTEKVFILQALELSIFDSFSQSSPDEPVEQQHNVELELQEIAEKLQSFAGPGTIVKYATSNFSLLRAIHEAIVTVQPDVIIAGSDSQDEETLIGDEVISIAKSSPVPVLVIPSACKYQTIKSVLVPCNFKDLSNLPLLSVLKAIESQEEVKLELLNVSSKPNPNGNKEEVEARIQELLKDQNYHLNYSSNDNIVDGILEFADNNPVQVVIALPGKHSFFYRLTHSSITQALTQNSSKPVLLLKEIEE